METAAITEIAVQTILTNLRFFMNVNPPQKCNLAYKLEF